MPGKPWINKRKPFKSEPFITKAAGARQEADFQQAAAEQDARQAMKRGKTPQAGDFAYKPPAPAPSGGEPE